jgi:hypothetical protein
MSLVGPRPIIKPELAKYSIYGEKLLTVKPGNKRPLAGVGAKQYDLRRKGASGYEVHRQPEFAAGHKDRSYDIWSGYSKDRRLLGMHQ